MGGAEAVVTLVLVEWAGGLLGAAGWTQSWSVVTRGHFRIVGWTAIGLGVGAVLAGRAAVDSASFDVLLVALVAAGFLFLGAQYVRSDKVGALVGFMGMLLSAVALVVGAGMLGEWPVWWAGIGLVAGMVLLGSVTNGMLLGHWYLNQPGLKPWALGRLTDASLAAVVAGTALGLGSAGRLAKASTAGSVMGLPGFGESFSLVFFLAWIAIAGLTAAVVWMARRCVKIRSIQSATGLFYVALLTAGVSEFLVRYLMVNS